MALLPFFVDPKRVSVDVGANSGLSPGALPAESNERHRPGAVDSVRTVLGGLGYAGFEVDDGRLAPITAFDPQHDHSVPPGRIRGLLRPVL